MLFERSCIRFADKQNGNVSFCHDFNLLVEKAPSRNRRFDLMLQKIYNTESLIKIVQTMKGQHSLSLESIDDTLFSTLSVVNICKPKMEESDPRFFCQRDGREILKGLSQNARIIFSQYWRLLWGFWFAIFLKLLKRRYRCQHGSKQNYNCGKRIHNSFGKFWPLESLLWLETWSMLTHF